MNQIRLRARSTLFSIAIITSIGCSALSEHEDPIRSAELEAEQGHYDKALELYQNHIRERLEVTNRADWENPHFYLLAIGDIYLRMEQPTKALEAYNEAERQHVEESLVTDRYRSVAHWYIEHRELNQAMKVLNNYRDRDSLLFDALLDHVARALTAQESPHSLTNPTPRTSGH